MKKYLVSYGEMLDDLKYYFGNLTLESSSAKADDILTKLTQKLAEKNSKYGKPFCDAVLINFWEI